MFADIGGHVTGEDDAVVGHRGDGRPGKTDSGPELCRCCRCHTGITRESERERERKRERERERERERY